MIHCWRGLKKGHICSGSNYLKICVILSVAIPLQLPQRLIQQAFRWAKDNGLPGIRLETQTTNVAACRFYLRQGFTLGGYDRHLYEGLSPGTRETALFFYRFF